MRLKIDCFNSLLSIIVYNLWRRGRRPHPNNALITNCHYCQCTIQCDDASTVLLILNKNFVFL